MLQGIPLIQPKIIHSPTGEPVRPRISTRQQGNFMVTEAVYIDPRTGDFLRKGIVSMTPIEPKK